MSSLYVIGNGFDIYHKLDTHYISYGRFLFARNAELYFNFLEFFGLPDVEGDKADYLWSQFESKLAELDTDNALERSSDYIANPGGADFRDRDWGAFAIEIENFVSAITEGMNETFKDFILSVKYPDPKTLGLLNLDRNAKFITFNYTDTLTRYYSIDPANILHIHGRANTSENEIILGHGIPPENFLSVPDTPPEGLNDEELDEWMQHQSDQYDYSFELGKSELQRYFESTYKRTEEIISANDDYFSSLFDAKNVFILGHSLSAIDIAYFKKLFSVIRSDANWHVSYYRDEEKEKHLEALKGIGVTKCKITAFRIHELSK